MIKTSNINIDVDSGYYNFKDYLHNFIQKVLDQQITKFVTYD